VAEVIEKTPMPDNQPGDDIPKLEKQIGPDDGSPATEITAKTGEESVEASDSHEQAPADARKPIPQEAAEAQQEVGAPTESISGQQAQRSPNAASLSKHFQRPRRQRNEHILGHQQNPNARAAERPLD
jgi:hypothetical protein